jgi:hypothetical protein
VSRGRDDKSLSLDDAALGAKLLPGLDGRPGPARRLSSAASAAMAASAVEAALVRKVAAAQPGEERHAVPRSGRGRGRAVAAAAVLLVAVSLAAGAAALVGRLANAPVEAVEPPIDRGMSPADEDRAVEPPGFPAAFEPARKVSKPASVRHKRRATHQPSAVRPSAVAREEPPEEASRDDAEPEDLLALANERRRAREWSAADALYRSVSGRFPGSDAAVVAEIASATLHLEQLEDARGALRGYRRALSARPTGPLSQEARWGVAEAHRALGDGAAEAAALRGFLAHHPESALAPAARRRQAELAP